MIIHRNDRLVPWVMVVVFVMVGAAALRPDGADRDLEVAERLDGVAFPLVREASPAPAEASPPAPEPKSGEDPARASNPAASPADAEARGAQPSSPPQGRGAPQPRRDARPTRSSSAAAARRAPSSERSPVTRSVAAEPSLQQVLRLTTVQLQLDVVGTDRDEEALMAILEDRRGLRIIKDVADGRNRYVIPGTSTSVAPGELEDYRVRGKLIPFSVCGSPERFLLPPDLMREILTRMGLPAPGSAMRAFMSTRGVLQGVKQAETVYCL